MTQKQACILSVARSFRCYLPHEYVGIKNTAKFYTSALSFCGDKTVISKEEITDSFLSKIDMIAFPGFSQEQAYHMGNIYCLAASHILSCIFKVKLERGIPYEIISEAMKEELKELKLNC